MKPKNYSILLFTLIFTIGLSAFMPQQEYRAKNLKVLPKNSTKEEIEEVMESFKVALGVKCSFCHVSRTDDPTKLDFASDDKIEKEIARGMMKMTEHLNKEYFVHKRENGLMAKISCQTCHNGKQEPEVILKEG